MEDNPKAIFKDWLERRTDCLVDTDEFEPEEGDLMRYVAAHGVPERIVSERGIRVAAYDGRFVGEVRGTGAVLVYAAGLGE